MQKTTWLDENIVDDFDKTVAKEEFYFINHCQIQAYQTTCYRNWTQFIETEYTKKTRKKFNARIKMITGLDHEMSELLQMGNYGVGGQYEPHWDHQAYPGADNKWDDSMGSRIARAP